MEVITTLEALDAKLAECDAAHKISDDALRQVFQTFRMDFSTDLPSDPFSRAYHDFQMAVYEHLIKELQKSGKFKNVYRDGDQGAANTPELITLRTNVTGFKHGSEEKRQVTTVSGSTSITIHCSFVDKSGNVKLERDITGKVRFLGGNLRATYDFAKKVAQVVEQSF